MKIAFRQGIIRYQSDRDGKPEYLVKSSNDGRYLDLNVRPDPCVITFAQGSTNYTIEETKQVVHAWGPFQPIGQTQYLYWDIDTISSILTRGFTILALFVGPTVPTNPQQDQHWFDLTSNRMKVWNGYSWIERIRLFAGTYDSTAIILPMFLGSQIGDNTQDVSGIILKDDQLVPLRKNDRTFLTSETNIQITSASNNTHSAIRFESLLTYVKAAEFIPSYSCVSFAASSTVMLGRYTNTTTLINGIVTEDMYIGDVSRLVTSGVVFNEQWNFPTDKIGKPLFCGRTGQITLEVPPSGVVQMIGHIDSNKTINLSIQSPVYYSARIG
jgi:hypothetical protein